MRPICCAKRCRSRPATGGTPCRRAPCSPTPPSTASFPRSPPARASTSPSSRSTSGRSRGIRSATSRRTFQGRTSSTTSRPTSSASSSPSTRATRPRRTTARRRGSRRSPTRWPTPRSPRRSKRPSKRRRLCSKPCTGWMPRSSQTTGRRSSAGSPTRPCPTRSSGWGASRCASCRGTNASSLPPRPPPNGGCRPRPWLPRWAPLSSSTCRRTSSRWRCSDACATGRPPRSRRR